MLLKDLTVRERPCSESRCSRIHPRQTTKEGRDGKELVPPERCIPIHGLRHAGVDHDAAERRGLLVTEPTKQEDEIMPKKEKIDCQLVGCDEAAAFMITDPLDNDPICRFCYSCEEHVGHLIGHTESVDTEGKAEHWIVSCV